MNAVWQLFQKAGLECWVTRNGFSKEARALAQLTDQVHHCRQCGRGETRKQPVFGAGKKLNSPLFILRASPDKEEEAGGLPFVGQAGRLFDAILSSQDLSRDQLYLSYLVKCRSGDKAEFSSQEWAACSDYTFQQIRQLQPSLIVVLGELAAQYLLKTDAHLNQLRGRAHPLVLPDGARLDVWVTYDPADLLTQASEKMNAWEDWKAIKAALS